MNKLIGKVDNIKINGSLALITIKVGTIPLKAIVIYEPEYSVFLKPGNQIKILIKETEVTLATDELVNISLQNKFFGKITEIENGELLTKVVFDFEGTNFSSIITTDSAIRLNVEVGKIIYGYVKTNEIIIGEL